MPRCLSKLRIGNILCCMSLFWGCLNLHAQEERLVGTYGDIRSATCSGITSFDVDDVLGDLDTDLVMIRFSRSLEPLDAFVSMVQKRLLAGLMAAGFLEAEVRVIAPPGEKFLNITVEEGKRRRWTSIDLPKDDKVLPKAFVEQYLTFPRLQDSDLPISAEEAAEIIKLPKKKRSYKSYKKPLLEIGEWADFSAGFSDTLQKNLERHCKAFGITACDVQVSCLSQDDTGAVLKIRFDTDDERRVLAAIDIADNTYNSNAEILTFLNQHGVAVGTFLTPSIVARTRACTTKQRSFPVTACRHHCL